MDPQDLSTDTSDLDTKTEIGEVGVDVAQVVDDDDKPVFKTDIYWTKRANMVALVAGMSVLTGLLATVFLTTRKQDIRQKAFDSLDLVAISRCVSGKAVVDVSVISPRIDFSGEIKDIQTNSSVLLGRVAKGNRVKAVIHTNKEKLESAAVELSVRFGDEQVYRLSSTYEGVECK